MAAIYSTLFYWAQTTAVGATNLYVVPAGFVAVLRDLTAYNGESTPQDFYLTAAGGSLGWLIFPAVPSSRSVEWQGRQVFNAGQTIGIYCGVAGFTVRASGYLLVAP